MLWFRLAHQINLLRDIHMVTWLRLQINLNTLKKDRARTLKVSKDKTI